MHYGWTFEELAARTGLHRNALSRIETGKRGISLEDACVLADTFGVPLADMIAADELVLTTRTRIG